MARKTFIKLFAAVIVLVSSNAHADSISCKKEIGAKQAKILVSQCLQVTGATHPPCNALNSCNMIKNSIAYDCKGLMEDYHTPQDIPAPGFCKDYANWTELPE